MAVTKRQFIFPDFTDEQAIAQLKTWLGWVNEEIATGKTTSAWSAGDTNASKWIDVSLPAKTRQAMILNDLSILDPENFDARDVSPIKRTTVRYIG